MIQNEFVIKITSILNEKMWNDLHENSDLSLHYSKLGPSVSWSVFANFIFTVTSLGSESIASFVEPPVASTEPHKMLENETIMDSFIVFTIENSLEKKTVTETIRDIRSGTIFEKIESIEPSSSKLSFEKYKKHCTECGIWSVKNGLLQNTSRIDAYQKVYDIYMLEHKKSIEKIINFLDVKNHINNESLGVIDLLKTGEINIIIEADDNGEIKARKGGLE